MEQFAADPLVTFIVNDGDQEQEKSARDHDKSADDHEKSAGDKDKSDVVIDKSDADHDNEDDLGQPVDYPGKSVSDLINKIKTDPQLTDSAKLDTLGLLIMNFRKENDQ